MDLCGSVMYKDHLDTVIDFLCITLTQFYSICRNPVIRLYLQAEWKTGVDPDQLASEKPADLDLHCFLNRIFHYIFI